MLPLQGVKVLDLSRLLPGPYASLVLADLGADVVKVEDPVGGDYLRWMPPLYRHQSGMFHALNRNKRSIAVNVKDPDGREVLLDLVAGGFDVVIESFRPGVIARLGLGYDDLKRVAPGVILCSITGYGQDGPRRSRAGHDLNYVGLSGVLGLTGHAGGAPVIPGVQLADVGGGSLTALVGLLSALHARSRTGEGAWIDVSMTEGALGFLTMQLGARFASGKPFERGAEALNGGYPCYDVYRTRDGRYMSLAAIEPQFWQRFCDLIDREDLATEGYTQGAAGARIKAELSAVFRSRTQAEWVALLAEHDVCCEPVLEGDDVLEDAQLQARGAFFEIEDPAAGPIRHVATPVRFVGGDEAPRRSAPNLGADTEAVLTEAGISESRRARLFASGAVK